MDFTSFTGVWSEFELIETKSPAKLIQNAEIGLDEVRVIFVGGVRGDVPVFCLRGIENNDDFDGEYFRILMYINNC